MHNIYRLTSKIPFASNCYLIEVAGEWAVVDPSVEFADALLKYPDLSDKLKLILVTHAHFDHIYAIKDWADRAVPVIVGANDAPSLRDPYRNCYLGFLGVEDGYFGEYRAVNDEDKLWLGGEEIEVISTPGHTPGSVSYKIGNDLFVGDTVFAGGAYGRSDLPGGDPDELDKSLFKLFSKMLIGRFYPGHGPDSTFEDAIKYFI